MDCPSCATANEGGRKFCRACGTRLARPCPSCGTVNLADDRFCGECGTDLAVEPRRADPRPAEGTGASAATAPTATVAQTERRLVTVLFADLVGFTGLAEDRDPEAVRELLTRYFDLARETIGRYGGTVEKFIGDAVMAVWGAPVAREDDAERAVRAALELVAAVRDLRPGVDEEPVMARAGVLTGEAATTVGATNQGMVAGDLVNTASRLQAVAPPGAVLVGEATFAATRDSMAYEPAGEQMLKGKSAPVPAWRATRVMAKIGGAGRSEGLEPPFVGRDEQFRLVKDLLHACWRDRRLHLVSVTGQAGIGKSRLAWELYKYIDGLVEDVYWHHGRSPSYGEGITFWALGEMVRKRAGLAESDDPPTTRARIAATLAEYVPDDAERRWMEPKLLGLLGLGELGSLEREELFAAWRTLFERVSERGVTVLVFEDLQWADAGVLDFIEHMTEWSSTHPILIVTLARPELLERRPDWGVGRRGVTALTLDPLPDARMDELLAGLVPGLPEAAHRVILARADGVPLYAVETVRMLLLDGRLERQGDVFRPVGDLAQLEVPDTLHALVAARLDALGPADRGLLQDASILGQTFTVPSLGAVTGLPVPELEPRLRELVRRDVLTQNRDPRSPERGQYGFVQALIREVAYGTMSRRDRRARHLAAARYFESLGDEELAGVLATHYLDAYRASEAGREADALAAQARVALRAAAERSAALHSPEQALAYLVLALEVTHDGGDRAGLLELAGEAAHRASRADEAERFYRGAIEAYRSRGELPSLARVSTALGLHYMHIGRASDGIEVLEPALREVADMGETREATALRAALARTYLFADEYDRALALIDGALLAAGRVDDVALITDAIVTKGTILQYMERFREGAALLVGGLALARDHELVVTEMRARLNISFIQVEDDPRRSLEMAQEGTEHALRLGIRDWARLLAGNAAEARFTLGDFDGIVSLAEDLGRRWTVLPGEGDLFGVHLAVRALQGAEVVAQLAELDGALADVTAAQERTFLLKTHLWVDLAAGRLREVLAAPLDALDPAYGTYCQLIVGHAAVWLGDAERAARAAEVMAGYSVMGRWVSAVRLALLAAVAGLEGHENDAEAGYREALVALTSIEAVRDVALLHMDRVAVARHDTDALAAAEAARPLLARMGARTMEGSLEALVARRATAPPGTGPIGRGGERRSVTARA